MLVLSECLGAWMCQWSSVQLCCALAVASKVFPFSSALYLKYLLMYLICLSSVPPVNCLYFFLLSLLLDYPTGLQLWDKQEARACGVDTLGPFEVKDKLLTCSVVHPICKMVVVMLGTVLAPCQKKNS